MHWELKTWSKLEQSIHLKFHVSLRGSEERSNFQYWTRQSSWFLTMSPLENWSRSSDVVSNSTQPRHSSSWSMTPISPQSLCQCQNYTEKKWTRMASSTWSTLLRKHLVKIFNYRCIEICCLKNFFLLSSSEITNVFCYGNVIIQYHLKPFICHFLLVEFSV